jgi:hypothetical protein
MKVCSTKKITSDMSGAPIRCIHGITLTFIEPTICMLLYSVRCLMLIEKYSNSQIPMVEL